MSFDNINNNINNSAFPFIFEVEHVKDWGRRGGISFTLRVTSPLEVSIYGCRIERGPRGKFIAFPSFRGKEGHYYRHAWMNLTDDMTDDIIDAVYDELEALKALEDEQN